MNSGWQFDMQKFEMWKRRVAIVLGVGTNGRSTSLNKLRGNGHIIALIWKLAIAHPWTWFTREYMPVLPPAPQAPDAPKPILEKCPIKHVTEPPEAAPKPALVRKPVPVKEGGCCALS